MKRLIAAFAVVSCAVSARAGITAGADQTFGSRGYRGTKIKAAVDIGEEFYLSPYFSTYRSDSSSGTYRTIGLRGGWEHGPLALAAEAAVQPKTNGYKREEIGGDATFSITPEGSVHGRKLAGPSSGGGATFGAGLAAIDVGAGIRFIRHSDDFQSATVIGGGSGPGPSRGSLARARTATATFGQTDFSVFGGLRFLMAEASVEVVKSRYDKDLNALNARESQFLELSGLDSIVQGFPDTSTNAKLSWTSLPFVKPYLSYTHTTFKLGAAPSNAYEAGAKVGLNIVSLKAGYELYRQSGYADSSYATIGASLNF